MLLELSSLRDEAGINKFHYSDIAYSQGSS